MVVVAVVGVVCVVVAVVAWHSIVLWCTHSKCASCVVTRYINIVKGVVGRLRDDGVFVELEDGGIIAHANISLD